MTVDHEIQKAAEILANANQAAASCGAGISAESGIATFRDPGGVWEKLNPAEVGTTSGLLNTLDRNAQKLIPFFIELLEAFEQSNPNPAHMALGALEEMGILKTVITQNIDNLHQEAGNTDVVEVHGNGFRLSCISCGKLKIRLRRELIAEIKSKIQALQEYNLSSMAAIMPKCDHCQALMRPDVVMFGEAVQELPTAFEAAKTCDVMLALGTSGVVYPAAYLPFEAKRAGASVIVVNPNENPFDSVSDAYVPMKTGEALPKIVAAVKDIKGQH